MKLLFCATLATMALLLAQEGEKASIRLIEVGQPVPAFRLNDHLGNAVAVAPALPTAESTWTVLAFFPKAATPG